MNLPPVIRQRYFDANGKPLAGGKLYTYQAATTTPQATYTDSSGSTPNPNPIILDANGEAIMWLDSTLSYKFVLKDSNDVQQWISDNVIGLLTAGAVATASLQDGSVTSSKLAAGAVNAAALASDAAIDINRPINTNNIRDGAITRAKQGPDSLIPTGVVLPFAGSAAPTGYLFCDGSPVSRTTYASLFAVIGTAHGTGDGSTTFNIPDYRWRTLRGAATNISAACSGTSSGNNVTATAHGLNHSGLQVRITGTPVTGLATGTDYYLIYVDANTVAFATTRANALIGTKIVISGSAASMSVVQYVDPDAATREAMSAGGAASGLGSIQDDQIGSHQHAFQYHNTVRTGTVSGAYLAANSGTIDTNTSATGTISASVQNTGGNETRAKNAYVNFIIRT